MLRFLLLIFACNSCIVYAMHTTLHGIFEYDIAKKMFFPQNEIRLGNTVHYINDDSVKSYSVIAAVSVYEDEVTYPQALMFYKDSTVYSVLHHPRMDLIQMFQDVRVWHDKICNFEDCLEVQLYDTTLWKAWNGQ